MRSGIIIQARNGSTRLPKKMTLPFYQDYTVLDILLDKVTKLVDYPIVLATTTSSKDDDLVGIADKYNVEVFRGDEDNVLDRFISAAKKHDIEYIIRVCADNPFLDVDHIPKLIKEMEVSGADYVSYQNEHGLPTIKTHLGLFTEAVTKSALEAVLKSTDEKLYLEHVTNYIYAHADDFNIKLLHLPAYIKSTENLRFTLDTQQDFDLYQVMYQEYKDSSTEDLVLETKKRPEVLNQMVEQIEMNQK